MIRYFISIIFYLLLSVYCSLSQTSPSSIIGTVTHSLGAPLPDVNIKIKGSYKGTATDSEGKYIINNVNPGEYTVAVSSIGFKTVEYTGIKVKSGENTSLNITLNTTAYNVGEEILVVGERPLLDIE